MSETSPRVVVVGGARAPDIEELVRAVASQPSLAIVVQGPEADGLAKRLRASDLPIESVRGPTRIEAGRIYVTSDVDLVEFRDRALTVSGSPPHACPLEILLRSAADTYGAQTIGVLLAGAGASLGARRIKEVGGITIAQAIDGVDTAPNADGAIDLVLGLDEIAARLHAFGEVRPQPDASSPSDGAADTLRDILALVRNRSGHDFSAYKRATLFRRISRRMQVCQTPTVADYHAYLRERPGEVTNLQRDFLISVTSFFRDRDAFEGLAQQILPRLLATKQPTEPVRVWVPGCATGEEVYSLAILLSEQIAQSGSEAWMQLFATDIDEEALAEARLARYPHSIAVDIEPARLERYFTPENGHYRITQELRELVLFSPHNLLRDPPFSRLDLISCRNLMIYLNREAQDQVLNLFHFAIRPEGYLFLGASESAENSAMFAAVDAKCRIFQRRPSAPAHNLDAIVAAGRWSAAAPVPPAPPPHAPARPSSLAELHVRLVEQSAPPSVLVNQALDIIHLSEHAGRYLTLGGGEPTQQLLQLALPPLRVELRSAIHAARQPGRHAERRTVRFDDGARTRTVELRVVASQLEELEPGALLVIFDEKEPSSEPAPVEPSAPATAAPGVRELEAELQRTRDQLRATIERYETSLEEREASNEELQAINEGLRAATEELESSQQELQSVNQELAMLNHALKGKLDELGQASSDLQNLMSSTDIGVLFVDRALTIKRFTVRAQDLFNILASDVGRPLAHLTHHLELADLTEQAQSVVQTLRTVEREVASRDGRRYLMRLLPYRSLDDRIEGVVMTFVDVTELRTTEAALAATEERLMNALQIAPIIMISLAADGRSVWGYALGKEQPADRVTDLFAPGHAEQLAEVTREVFATRTGRRVELDVTVEGRARTYDFRVEPTGRGIHAIGFDITPGKLA